jgi:serine/threonine-protein kinase
MIGRIIGNYKIESKLGEGGMGAVYKGVDTMLDREVAIKALRPELTSQAAVVERFRSEAVTLAKLHHPNIATLYSLFRHGDELYMVLEYVRGETLDSILQKRGALPSGEVIPVFCQILDGINHAHEYGIVHRDIKPANMMLTEKGTLKVLDFGIARLLGSNRMTRAGSIIGTLEYMAPEQVKGNETDARTDIYALGMMLYEVLTGRAPFDTDNEFELMQLQTEAMPPAPRSINSSISEEVEAAIMRAIQKKPEDRFQTAGDFRESLLDAGFAAQGAMRRNTGSRQSSANTNSSQTPISKPEAAKQTAIPENTIKETRLGAANAVSHSVYEAKETRLGESAAAAPFDSMLNESPPSFFDNLTWIHYAGAGSAAVVLLALLIILPLFILSGNTRKENVTEPKLSNTPATENKTQKAEIMTTPAPTPVVIQQPVLAESPETVVATPISTPIAEPPPARAANTSKLVERTKSVPPPAPKPAPAAKKKSGKTQEQKLREARCALVGC